jgi:predicted nucleic acid-binding protein
LSSYADASFLFSLYALDAHSARAKKLLANISPPLVLSDLGQLEFINALRLALHRKALSTAEVDELDRLFHQDISAGTLIVRPVNPVAFTEAFELARKHTAALNVRTLDVLHVACALTLRMRTFYTFDHRQSELAKVAGLRVN